MTSSDPYIGTVNVPTEAPPGTQFNVSAEIGNLTSPDIAWFGTCYTGPLGTQLAWQTPFRLYLDGERVWEDWKCVDAETGPKTVSRIVEFETVGDHTIEWQAWTADGSIGDSSTHTVTVSDTAENPNQPSLLDEIAAFFQSIPALEWLGGTTFGLPNVVIALFAVIVVVAVI